LPAIFVICGAFVLLKLGDLRHMAFLLRGARPGWLVLACIVECLRSVSNGKLFQTALGLAGYRFGWGEMIAKVTAFNAVNRIVPTGGASGSALMVATLQSEGVPPDRALFAIGLTYIYDYLTYLLVVAATFVYLAVIGHLPGRAVLAAALLVAVIGGVIGFLWWGLGKQEALERTLAGIVRRLRRLRPSREHSETPEASASAMVERMGTLRRDVTANPKGLLRPVAPALGYNVLDVFNVWCVFQAFGHPQPIGFVAAGFVIAMLLGFISFIPGQLGAFEVGMAGAFHTLFGVNLTVAMLVTGTYRLIQYWLPIPIGVVLAKHALHGTKGA
jgi:hypothetical protein